MALEAGSTKEGDLQMIWRRLKFSEISIKAGMKFFSMREQYFCDVTEQGIEVAKQMAFLV